MKPLLLLLLFFSEIQFAFSQTEKEKSRIGISVPVIYNNSSAVYYQTGNRKTPTGDAISYGANVNYIQPIFNHVFLKGGIGYFRQNFRIERPFHFNDPTALLFRTKSYTYENLNLSIGVGVNKKIKSKLELELLFYYISSSSFQQKYTPTFHSNSSLHKNQVNSKFFHIGDRANIELGVMKHLSSKVSVGGHLIYPFIVHWNKDPIFINNYYSTDEMRIAKNNFSVDVSLSVYHHF